MIWEIKIYAHKKEHIKVHNGVSSLIQVGRSLEKEFLQQISLCYRYNSSIFLALHKVNIVSSELIK